MMGVLGILLFSLMATQAMADEGARSMVRARLEPTGHVVVGQPVKLIVDVLVTTWFTSAPEFPLFDLPGALVVQSDEQAPHLTEEIHGATWFGLTQTYIITPMEPHEFTIPRLHVVLHPGMSPGPVKVWSPTRKFTAKVPAGAEGVAVFLSTDHLKTIQRFDHKLAGLHVGDAFTRTITSTAKGTQAMFIPPFPFAQVEGLAVYPNVPQVQNLSADRKGFIAGRRIDSASYLIQKPGHYELPGVTVQWWDLRLGKLREHTIAPVSFDAARNPHYRPEIAPPADIDEAAQSRSQDENMRRWAIWGVGALAGFIVIWLCRPKLISYWSAFAAHRAEQRRRYETSEAAAFAELEGAVAHGDDRETIQWLYQWLDRCQSVGKPALAERAVALADDEPYRAASEALLARCFGSRQTPPRQDGTKLQTALHHVRGRLIGDPPDSAHRMSDLPPLNPV